ncbi:transposase, partial [bacterium]|nr:transposase [bacterium]
SNLALIFLPPVSPQLNPIERLWKKIKTDFFHNRLHNNIEDIKRSIKRALASLCPQAIASICSCGYLNTY